MVQFSVGYGEHRFFTGGSLCLFVSCILLNVQDPPKEFIPKEVPKKVQKESPVPEKVEASRRKYVEISASEDENENPVLQKEYSAFKYLLEAASDARNEEHEEAAPPSVHRPCSEGIKLESPERVQDQEVPFFCLSPYLWILFCLRNFPSDIYTQIQDMFTVWNAYLLTPCNKFTYTWLIQAARRMFLNSKFHGPKSFTWSYPILQLMLWLLQLVGAVDFVTSYLTIKFRASPLWLSHCAMAVQENCLQERNDCEQDF